ncbi:MAG TPA: transporter substrate-binding domain-containing protein, partial [Negativicutes bacterium]
MKKVTILLVCFMTLVTLILAGCGGAPKASAPSGDTVPPDIKAIKDRGVLKVGVKVDVPKFGFKNLQTGQVEGMEIDLTKAIAKKILGDDKKFEVQGVTAKTRGPLLDNGEVDLVIATFTITEERKQSYNFSDPYFTDGVALMVKKSSGIQSLKDLAGKKIGVAQSATSKKA